MRLCAWIILCMLLIFSILRDRYLADHIESLDKRITALETAWNGRALTGELTGTLPIHNGGYGRVTKPMKDKP